MNYIFMAGLLDWIGDKIQGFFFYILLWVNAIIYSFVSFIYQIFLVLAQSKGIFDETLLQGIVNRVYIIIGVVVLFLVAYSLLKSMINPDEALKGKKSPVKVIGDVLISIALIAFVPTIFDIAFDFQAAVLNHNTIGKIIAGSATDGSQYQNNISEGGYNMAEGVWKAFIYPAEGYCGSLDEEDSGDCEVITITGLGEGGTEKTYGQLWDDAKRNKTFWEMAALGVAILDGKVTYLFLLDIIAGIFVLLALLSYCLDTAVRLVKLSVYEIIAPLPILARIVPNDQANKMFSNWLKATISTFLEVFIRIAILYFAVIIIAEVGKSLDDILGAAFTGSANIMIEAIAEALIILGIIMFVKQAPEIIKEITGLDGGKYNVLKSAKQGLSLIAGGIAGGSPLSAYRAWDQAGQSKDLLDFSAIGNQYKRRQAQKEAKEQGASFRDRAGDSLRKRFGFETKLERANRRIERGLDMEGNVQNFVNDTDGDIKIILPDGSTKVIAKGGSISMDDRTLNDLQHKKDINAQELSEFDEQIRHVKEGKDLDQKYIDWRGKIKKKALEKINEGHNHVKENLIYSYVDSGGTVHNENMGSMNYAAMLAFKQSRINAGASAEEISALEEAIKKNEDKMWVDYSNWAIQEDVGGEISTWFDQAKQFHDEVGIYDADSGKLFQYDIGDLSAQMSSVVGSYVDKSGAVKDLRDHMALFESSKIKIVDKATGGAFTYTDSHGVTHTKTDARGFDKCAKANANGADTIVQGIEIQKTAASDENKRIDRVLKQVEEAKTEFKSSAEYQKYKAADNANKINDSGKK